jgi:molybdopterin molybdotransferase
MIPVKEALDIILNEINPLGAEEVEILSAPGRVLAEDIRADRPNPPWDNSAMDGYALKSADLAGASEGTPATLKVLYDLPAGSVPEGPVTDGTAVRIMTGAPVPDGADAVVMVEKTERAGDDQVRILSTARPGDNIRKSGEDFKKGELVIKEGSIMRPAEVLMCATIGRARVKVRKRPVAAVISTGDELIDIDAPPEKGKITNSNGYALASLVADAGAEPLRLGIAGDTRESLVEKLTLAVKADCIITSGGVSVGDYDLVKDVLKGMGSTMRFWKVAMKPGKPLAFGIIQGKPAFGLPGNPISSMVAFEQFVRPALLKMAGRTEIFKRSVQAVLTEDLKIKPGRMNFLKGVLKEKGEGGCGFAVTPLKGQGSGVVSTMVTANAFIIVPPDSEGFKKGETVRVQPFDQTALYGVEPGF